MYTEDDYLMISGIQHFLFCKRQWALIHLEQLWAENSLTVEGRYLHQKADQPFLKERRKEKIIARGMPIQSSSLGITGICDVVEFVQSSAGAFLPEYGENYQVIPVEYKHGKEKFDLSDEMQLTAQALCLEEMLVTEIPLGYLFYFETRKRVAIPIDRKKRQFLEATLQEMHHYWKERYTPKVKKQKKCKRCSLKDICLPELEGKQTVASYLTRRLKE